MNADTLFEEVGFTKEYRHESESFYRPFFENENALNSFFYMVFKNDDIDKTPRKIMNHIVWFVSLANDIDIIRPGRDPLRMLFLRICLESICKTVGAKIKDFFDSFASYFSENGKQYILSHFLFTQIAIPDELEGVERLLFDTHEDYHLSIDDFLKILRATRNMVAHDGDYWSMQFFARDTDSEWLSNMTTDEKMISCQPKQKGKELTYCFQTTMQYEKFIFFFVEACINYLKCYTGNIASGDGEAKAKTPSGLINKTD